MTKNLTLRKLTSKEAIAEATKIYETTTYRKVGSGSKTEKTGAFLFFGSLAFLFLLYILKLYINI